MSIANLFTKNLKMQVSNDNGSWRQFILDHLDYISRNSRTYELSPALMNRYSYDLSRFLKIHLNRHEDISWIVLLLNSMNNDFEFDEITDLIVPDDSLITKLYASYRTVSQENN